MKKCLILTLVLCVLAACGGEPSPTPDLVATQIAVEIAAHATMTARVPTATGTPEPAATATAAEPPAPTSVPSHTPSPGPTVTPPPIIEAEEYAVYSALIEQNPIGYNLGSTLVIRDQTTVLDAEQFKRTLEHVPALPGALADSYRSRNTASYTLSPNLELEQDYVLMSQAEYDRFFPRGGGSWAEFEIEYPESGGVVHLSRVGFGPDGDTALVLMGFHCGELCGAGGLYLLVKEEDGWKVQQELMAWMS